MRRWERIQSKLLIAQVAQSDCASQRSLQVCSDSFALRPICRTSVAKSSTPKGETNLTSRVLRLSRYQQAAPEKFSVRQGGFVRQLWLIRLCRALFKYFPAAPCEYSCHSCTQGITTLVVKVSHNP